MASVSVCDSVSLVLAENILKNLLPPEMLELLSPKFEQARKKLSSLSEHPYSSWVEKVRYVSPMLPTRPPVLKPGMLENIQDALMTEEQIEVTYAPFNRPEHTLILHPCCLVQKGPTSYLIARAYDYPECRLFAVHRFQHVVSTGEPARIPEDFQVDDYLASGAMEFGSAKTIKLKADLSHELASYLTETPVAEDQKISHRKG